MSSPKLVILGGMGMLGHKMFQRLRERFPATACIMRQRQNEPPANRIPLLQGENVTGGVDAMDFDSLVRQLRQQEPHFIINCIGIIKQREASRNHVASITVNSLLPHKLADLAAEWDGRVIHFSTDCVFSGRRGQYTEEDASDAEDLYGKTKFLGETAEANALTLRTSIIGRELTAHRSLLDWFLSHNHGRVKGYRKSIYSGVTTNHLCDVVGDIILRQPRLAGLYQVASEPISKFDLLQLLRQAYGLDIEIESVDGEVADRSMNGSKFREATGYICPPWTTLVKQLANDPTPYSEWLNTPL